MKTKIKSWLWSMISSNLPADYELEVLRKIILINIMSLLGCFFIFIFSIVAIFQLDYILGISNLIIFSLLIFLFLYTRKTKNFDFAGISGTMAVFLFYLFLFAYGGVSKTAYMWSFSFPLIAIYLLGTRFGTLLSLLFMGLTGGIFFLGPRISFVASYETNFIIRFLPTYFVIYLFSMVVEKVRKIFQNRLTASNSELEKEHREKDRLIKDLQESMLEIKTLQGILPMCAKCKKIRDDEGYWEQVEKYVQDRSEAQFSHGICPECASELYPGFKK